MPLTRLTLADLTVEDESSFRHVAIYAALKAALKKDGVSFALGSSKREDQALLLNLAFWKPGDVLEILADDHISADQVAHNAWHHIVARQLGDAARSTEGLVLAEAIASAFDAYLVGRLLGHAPSSSFLETQVPAMADAAHDAGLQEAEFETLLQRMSDEPEASFEQLRSLLYDVGTKLAACTDADDAALVLEQSASHPFAPLLHHYELPGWVLFTKAYADGDGSAAREVDAAMRAASDSVAWLEERWLASD
jgi:hypothetical protein